jgi:hypothetical protein
MVVDGLGQCFVELLQLGYLRRGDPLGRRRRQLPGDRGLQPKDVLHIAAGQGNHDVTAVRFERNHALAAQGA